MFTRCPKCQTIHPLTARVLSQARGLVQCGQCGRPFSALSFLFDDQPSGQAQPPVSAPGSGPPIIGTQAKPAEEKATGKQKREAEPRRADAGTDADAKKGQVTHSPHRLAWGLATVLLVLVTTANLGWTFRESLVKNPTVNAWLKQNGWLQVERQGLLSEPGQIQLISRDMHSHPTRSGILILSLTFVNLAQDPQTFPVLQITLLDASNQPIAQRRFQPGDYLRTGADIKTGLAADVFLPVLLELGDPGEQAVGFEIQFL